MEENNKASQYNGVKLMSNAPFQSLLTLERSQKLDLLIHLITNLRQSLIVCGSQGIGKTTLLTVLQEKTHETRQYCFIKGSSALSFEQIQEQISQTVQQLYGDEPFQLTNILTQYDKQNHKLVVIIDDAENLVSGLAGSLVQYAVTNPALRVIFSLDNDGLTKKLTTDHVLSDCHFIELPPLTHKQCAEFVQQQARDSISANSINALDSDLIDRIYRDSQGIPGKILDMLPLLNNRTITFSHGWIYLAGVGALIALALSYIDWSDDEADKKTPVVKPALQPVNNQGKRTLQKQPLLLTEIAAPVITSPLVEDKPKIMLEMGQKTAKVVSRKVELDKMVLPIEDKLVDVTVPEKMLQPVKDAKPVQQIKSAQEAQSDSTINTVPAQKLAKNDLPAKKMETSQRLKPTSVIVPVKPKPSEKAFVKPIDVVSPVKQKKLAVKKAIEPVIAAVTKKTIVKSVKKKVKPVADDRKWLVTQSSKNYTIQLMALSQLESAKKEIQKHSELKEKIKIIKIVKKSKAKYLLLYGSFVDALRAGKAMQSLPKAYRKSWVRKIKDLQKEAR